jgi:hypothetical protein
MRVVPDRRRLRRTPDVLTVEDLISAEAFDHELDGRESRKFLPPPRVRARRLTEPMREPESRFSKLAKLAGLTTATSLLVGAVVASSVLSRERTEQPSRANLAPPPITGAAALAGFAMPGAGPSQPHPVPSSPVFSAPQRPVAETQPAVGGVASSNPPTTTTATVFAVNDSDKVAVVRKFYQRMNAQRLDDALSMLAPALIGDQTGYLVRAWSSMKSVEVNDAHVQSDGSVRAVVTMLQEDGTRLRVTQVLSLAEDVAGMISQAVLLSAEQL